MLETLLRACKSPNAIKTLQPLQNHLRDELQRLRDNTTSNANKMKDNEDKLASSGQNVKSLQDKLASMMNDLRALSPTEAQRLSKEFADQYDRFARDPHNSQLAWQTSNTVASPSSPVFPPTVSTSASVPTSAVAVPLPPSTAPSSNTLAPIPLSSLLQSVSIPLSSSQSQIPVIPPSSSPPAAAAAIALVDNKQTPSQALQANVSTSKGIVPNAHHSNNNTTEEHPNNELTDRRK